MFAIRHQHGPDFLREKVYLKKNPIEKRHRTQGNVNGYKTKNRCLISFIARKNTNENYSKVAFFTPHSRKDQKV